MLKVIEELLDVPPLPPYARYREPGRRMPKSVVHTNSLRFIVRSLRWARDFPSWLLTHYRGLPWESIFILAGRSRGMKVCFSKPLKLVSDFGQYAVLY
jgi:hypothetical protein